MTSNVKNFMLTVNGTSRTTLWVMVPDKQFPQPILGDRRREAVPPQKSSIGSSSIAVATYRTNLKRNLD